MRNAVYEVRISDWSSEVCSSDLPRQFPASAPKHSGPDSSRRRKVKSAEPHKTSRRVGEILRGEWKWLRSLLLCAMLSSPASCWQPCFCCSISARRSEEHTSELTSLMRLSYSVFCLTKQTNQHTITPLPP